MEWYNSTHDDREPPSNGDLLAVFVGMFLALTAAVGFVAECFFVLTNVN